MKFTVKLMVGAAGSADGARFPDAFSRVATGVVVAVTPRVSAGGDSRMPRVPAFVTSPVGVSDLMIWSTLGPDCASAGPPTRTGATMISVAIK